MIEDFNEKKYVTIAQGKMYYKCEEDEPKAVFTQWTVGDKSGSYWRREFKSVIGKITEMEYKISEEYGAVLQVTVTDDQGDSLTLQFKAEQSLHDSFLNSLSNVPNINDTIKISATKGKDGKGTSVWISQYGENVKWQFTKDNPGNVPQATKKTVMGKTKWDWSEVHEFWFEYAKSTIIPKISGSSNTTKLEKKKEVTEAQPQQSSEESIAPQEEPTFEEVEESDDLPF